MPELPEVEITRLGILKRVGGRRCTGAVVRETRFRKSAPTNLSDLLTGQRLRTIERRGKYLIWYFDQGYIVSQAPDIFGAGPLDIQNKLILLKNS